MFIMLNNSEFINALHLLNAFRNHNAGIESILNGLESGYIFVNDKTNPTIILIHQVNGFFFLHGKYNNNSFKSISKYLFDELKLDCIEIIISDLSLEKAIPIIYNDKNFKVFTRKVLKFNKVKYESFFKKYPFRRKKDIEAKIINKKKQLCVKLYKKNNIISTCQAIIGNKEVEINVKTEEKYRRKGYALYALKLFIDKVLERNLVPLWSCWDFNKASIGLAEKLFFYKNKSVKVYLWDVYN